MPARRAMTPREWALILALSLLWGGSFFLNEVALTALPPLTFVAARVVLAAAVLYAVVRATGLRMPTDRRTWSAFLVLGLLNNALPWPLFVWSQTYITSGLAAILNATAPFFTVLVAHALTRDEKLTGARLAGALVGFGGVAAMVGGEVTDVAGSPVLPVLAGLFATLCYAFAVVFGRRFHGLGLAPLVTATGMLTVTAILLVPLALAFERPWGLPVPGAAASAAVLGSALLSTALAFIVYFRLLASTGATNVTLVTLLIPVTAILLGVTILGETLALRHLTGMAAVGLGLAIVDGRPWAALRARLRPPGDRRAPPA